MYKIGMYGGNFNPLHQGHVSCIIRAANQCEKLYVVLSNSNSKEEIPYQHRFRWLKQLTKDMENVEVIQINDNSSSKDKYNWKQGSQDVKNAIGKHIDVIFRGSDYYDSNDPFSVYYPDSNSVYINRKIIPISSTEIRENPMKYWDYIADVAKPYFVKKVMITGTESCGKSTLVRNLAKYYNTSYVEEKGRNICDFAGGYENMLPSDYLEILHTHKLSEIQEQRKANRFLFIDTNSIVTDYYLKLQFKNTYKNIVIESNLASAISNLNKYDLVLYLEDDVPWVQDGTRTFGEDNIRIQNNNKLKKMMRIEQLQYYSIAGNYQERFLKSIELIDKLLA